MKERRGLQKFKSGGNNDKIFLYLFYIFVILKNLRFDKFK